MRHKKETWTREEVKAALDSQADILQGFDKAFQNIVMWSARVQGERIGCFYGAALALAGVVAITAAMRGIRWVRRKVAPGE